MVDSDIVDKFGLPVWVEDGAQFSAGDLRRFVGVQERGHCPEWLASAPTILPQMDDVSKMDILSQDLDSSMESCEVSDDVMLGNQDPQSFLQDPEWIRARTVVIQIEYNHLRTSVRRDDVIDALVSQAGVGTDQMIGLDPVSGGPHWEVVLKTMKATSRVIAKGFIRVADKFPARLMALGEELVQMRLLWLPLRVTNNAISRWASQFAKEVVSIEYERVGGEGRGKVMSFARNVVVRMQKGKSKEDHIPHKGPVITSEGEAFVSLILVKGRASLCLKCGELGHVLQNCGALWCSLCRRWTDHGYNSCHKREQSFANMAKHGQGQGQRQGQGQGQGQRQGQGHSQGQRQGKGSAGSGASVASEPAKKKQAGQQSGEGVWQTQMSKRSRKAKSKEEEVVSVPTENQFQVLGGGEAEAPKEQREEKSRKRADREEGNRAVKSRRQQEEQALSVGDAAGAGGSVSSPESPLATPMEESVPCGQGDPGESHGGTSQDTLSQTDLGLTSVMSDLDLLAQASAGSQSSMSFD